MNGQDVVVPTTGAEYGPDHGRKGDHAFALLCRLDHYERRDITGNDIVLSPWLGRQPTCFAESWKRCLADSDLSERTRAA